MYARTKSRIWYKTAQASNFSVEQLGSIERTHCMTVHFQDRGPTLAMCSGALAYILVYVILRYVHALSVCLYPPMAESMWAPTCYVNRQGHWAMDEISRTV